MMICPETFYEERLKNKNAAEIMTVIRSLKQEIGRLKNIVENPDYEEMRSPSERVCISCFRVYLERAKQALSEVGGTYTPSVAERKAQEFEENVPHIKKVVFTIGGYFGGYKTKTYTFDDDKACLSVEHSLNLDPSDFDDSNIKQPSKEAFLERLQSLHIGEWRRHYDTKRFGYFVCDGTQWELEIGYSNGLKPVQISGDNAYPYNFDNLLDLLEMEEE